MRIVLPVLAALIPAAMLPGVSFYFDITPKIVLLLAGVALVLLFWNTSLRPATKSGRWMIALLGFQFLWMAIATAVSTHPALSLNGGNWRRLGLISYAAVLTYSVLVTIDCSGPPDRVIRYLRAIVLAGIPIGLYGIAQYFGFDPLLDPAGYHAGEGPFTIVRPPSTLGHSNYFGAYLVYVVFVAIALTTVRQTRFWRTSAIASGVIATMAILFSGTRAAMLGLAVGIFVLAMRGPVWKTQKLIQAAGTAVAVLIALFVSPAGQGLRSRVHWALEEPVGGARPLLWRDTIRMAADRLSTGYGPETFGTEFPKYESVSLAQAYPDFQHESPHNVFLDALTSQGIPGVLLSAAIAMLALYLAFLTPQSQPISPVLGAALAGGLTAQQFNVFTLPTALYFYLEIALITACGVPSSTVKATHVWTRILATLLAITFAAYAGQLTIVDRELALTRSALTRVDIGRALAHYSTVEKWHPGGSSADLYLSRELANQFRLASDVRIKLQTWTPAFRAAARAATTSEERQNAFYNLAIFFATQNDVANVERSLRNAILWAPNWFKPHWTLAKLYLTQQRIQEAESEARRAVELNGGKDREVTQTLTDIRSAIVKR